MQSNILLNDSQIVKMLESAYEAMDNAYAPYSKFRVGAAVLTDSNVIYNGCNIENASYGATNCAERTAIFKAASEGCRNIKAVAIVSSKKQYTPPCGICRQVMTEFMDKDGVVILGKCMDDYKIFSLKELMPLTFEYNNM